MRRKYGTASDGISEEAAFELGVVYSAVKDELVAFAAKEGSPYSFADVAARVSKLLQAEALREQLRHPEHLSQMRQNGAGHHRGRPPKSGYDELAAAAQVFAGPSSARSLSAKARKAIAKAQRERWARFHDQQERQRKYSRETKQRQRAGVATPGKASRKQRSSGMRGYWANMTEEQRTAEMARRYKVRIANGGKPSGGGIRKPMNAAQRKRFSKIMTAAYARKRAEKAAQQDNNSAA